MKLAPGCAWALWGRRVPCLPQNQHLPRLLVALCESYTAELRATTFYAAITQVEVPVAEYRLKPRTRAERPNTPQ